MTSTFMDGAYPRGLSLHGVPGIAFSHRFGPEPFARPLVPIFRPEPTKGSERR